MFLRELMHKPSVSINEGGNLSVNGHAAQQIDLKVHNRSIMVPLLQSVLKAISNDFSKTYSVPLWDSKLLQSNKFLSGSSLHFFNTSGISDEEFVAKKPKVGDIDTQVNKEQESQIEEYLKSKVNSKVGPATLLGFGRGNEQFSSLWELENPPIKVQIDLEFVKFDSGEPTVWAHFSHSSSWDDLQVGVKGVFHKFLIQSLTGLTTKDFLLRKIVVSGKTRQEQYIPTTSNMVSFAVSSKEGGGLRAKYLPVLDDSGTPIEKDGLPVMRKAPTKGYEQNIRNIFLTIFGKRMSQRHAEDLEKKFWSFTGLLHVINTLLSPEEKITIRDAFIAKLFREDAQGLYKNDPDRDEAEKMAALNKMLEVIKVPAPKTLQDLVKEYKASYKMTEALEEADAPDFKRKGIKHIYNPGSSTEVSDRDFVQIMSTLKDKLEGKLDDITINLKVDGAGIRFGRDKSGRPFFLTSKVTTPLYIDDIGHFENYVSSKEGTAEQLTRAKQYDEAMSIILKSSFVKVLPEDTIVQAEMLFNPMAEETETGLKFVNISYDKSLLGSIMTIVPFMIKVFSTGEDHPDEEKIKEALLSKSSNKVKIISNRLKHSGLDITAVIDPVVNMTPELAATLAPRTKDSEGKRQAQEIVRKAKEALASYISDHPGIIGKDILGKELEGLILNLPNATLKVTSPAMKKKMADKLAAKRQQNTRSGKVAVVTAGSFVGHKGHEQLVNFVLKKANELKADPYVYISSKVGPDDPIPPQVKLQTWKKLFPQYSNIFHLVQEGGSVGKKIEKELVTVSNPPPYDKIIMLVGEDRYADFKKWMEHLSKRMKNPQYPGFEHVEFEVENTPRAAEHGGTGMSFTKLRNILKDPNATEEQQLALWKQGFDVAKLGEQWVKHLMDITRTNMGVPAPTKEDAAGVGIITKQNSTKDVGPGTLRKNLKAFSLTDDIDRSVEKVVKFLTLAETKSPTVANTVKKLISENRDSEAIKIMSSVVGEVKIAPNKTISQMLSEEVKRIKYGRS